MKYSYIKLITILAILTVLLLQVMWLFNTYNLLEKELYNKINSALSQSVDKELTVRLSSTKIPEGTVISGEAITNEGGLDTGMFGFQELLISFNRPLSLSVLDSIYFCDLKENNISVRYIINKIDPKTNKILKTTASDSTGELKGGMKSKIVPITKDNSEGIQAIIISPYEAIFQKMTLLLIASAIMAVVIGYCLFFQVKMIIRQNKIAQLRQDFTYAMIHDMKTPLSTILMGLNALKSGKLDDKKDKKDKYFAICAEESEHLHELAEKILTIAKLEENKLTLDKENIDLHTMIDTLIEKFKVKSTKEVVFTTFFSQDANFVVADQGYLKEAISNLIDNAIKYSHEKVNINISCIKENHYIKIKVKDNGLGISLRDQAKIFEKFERAAAVGKKDGATGFGLGLNYVLRVVQAHNGTIDVFSSKGEFSEFSINLPILMEEL